MEVERTREQLEFRAATHDDVSAISTMQKASLPETYGPFLGRPAVDEFIAGGNVDRYFEENWQHATVASLGGDVVGVAVLIGNLLDLIWVKPSLRSNGIGSALLEAVERRAAPESSELTLEVWTVNGRAVAFYDRLGFSIGGAVADPGTSLEKLVMRKTLA
jgi:GNAT superfamily N-acetyltransferase